MADKKILPKEVSINLVSNGTIAVQEATVVTIEIRTTGQSIQVSGTGHDVERAQEKAITIGLHLLGLDWEEVVKEKS